MSCESLEEASSTSTGSDTRAYPGSSLLSTPRREARLNPVKIELPPDEHYCSKDQLEQNHESKGEYI